MERITRYAKFFVLLFGVPLTASASYFPPGISTGGVAGSTIAVTNAVGTNLSVTGSGDFSVDGSTVGVVNGGSVLLTTVQGSTLSVVGLDGTSIMTVSTQTVVKGSTVGIVNGGGTLGVYVGGSTVGVVNVGGSYYVGNSTVGIMTPAGIPISVVSTGILLIPSVSAQPTVSTYTTVVSTGLPVITAIGTQLTVVSTGIPVTITNAGTAIFISSNTSSTFTAVGTTVSVVGLNGTSVMTVSTQTYMTGSVSSSTIYGPYNESSTQTVVLDPNGRILTSGMPYGAISSTWSVNVSSGTGFLLLVSSATQPKHTYLCGCIFTNSAATATSVTISRTVETNALAVTIGVPANSIPAGIWPGCSQPFFASAQGGCLYIKASAAAASTSMYCQYYAAAP
jgi:hypothetical protein